MGHESGLACVDSDYMYVAATNDCWLLDVETGKKARGYTVPDKKSDWGVFFIESRNATLPGAAKGIIFLRDFLPKDAFLVALDLKTGEKKWDKPFTSKGEEIFYLSCTPDALLTVTCANTPFKGQEASKGKNYYQLRLLDAKDGAQRWGRSVIAGKQGYAHNVNIQPAVIMGDKAYLSMRTGGRLFTFDMATGKHTELGGYRNSKGCGITSASATSLFFRNMVSQGYDTVSKQTFWTSSISRPSCWLNDIPAGGLVLMPEASTGCTCAFAIRLSIVLAPQK